MTTTPAPKKRQRNNFIDNKEFYAAIVEYRKKVDVAKEKGLTKKDEGWPRIPRYIGKCFLDIAEHLSCLLYTSPSPRDRTRSRMPSSA